MTLKSVRIVSEAILLPQFVPDTSDLVTNTQLNSTLGNYASANHTHTGYASSTHGHSGYASSSHSHSQYATQTWVTQNFEAKGSGGSVSGTTVTIAIPFKKSGQTLPQTPIGVQILSTTISWQYPRDINSFPHSLINGVACKMGWSHNANGYWCKWSGNTVMAWGSTSASNSMSESDPEYTMPDNATVTLKIQY